MNARVSSAIKTVADVLQRVDPDDVEAACSMIASAKTVGVYGCGREGYQMRGFAMRLFHLGLGVGYVGDTTMPSLGTGGLLVVSSGPGGLATVDAHIRTARSSGASVILVTAQPNTWPADSVDLVLAVPAQTMADDHLKGDVGILPMGSTYEGALFFLCEWIIADLKRNLGETDETITARHTNME